MFIYDYTDEDGVMHFLEQHGKNKDGTPKYRPSKYTARSFIETDHGLVHIEKQSPEFRAEVGRKIQRRLAEGILALHAKKTGIVYRIVEESK